MIALALDGLPQAWLAMPMLSHTMIISFDSPIPDDELDRYLADIETLMRGGRQIESFQARRHIRVPADDHSPVFAATAVVQIGVADLAALNAMFETPGVEDLIERWQAKFPYKVVWVNHEPFA